MPGELRHSHKSRSRAIGRLAERFAELPAWQVIAACAVLFAVVFLVRTTEDDPEIGIHLFYIVPVILLAVRFGVMGGIAGAFVSIALFLAWTLTDHDDVLDLATWFSPAFNVLLTGGMVGYFAGRFRQSENRFRTAAENQLEPFVIYDPVRDEDGRICDFRAEFINSAGAEAVGLPAEELTGKLLSELFPGRLEHGLLEEYVKVVETGEPYFREASDYVNLMGEDTLVLAFDIRVARIEDGSGMIETTWRDITEKLRTERERDWLAAIVENASVAVLSVDPDGTVVSWSPSAEHLYGYTRDEALGRSSEFLFDDRVAAERRDYLTRVLDGERPGPLESIDICKDGSDVKVTQVSWPILDEDGEVIGAARIVREADV